MSGKQTTVLVADDHVLVRYGLRTLVTDILGEVRLLEAHDFDSFSQVACLNPGLRLALIDLRMPGMQGGFRLLELARRHPMVPLVVLSAPTSAEAVRRIMNVRTVYAFVPKNAATDTLRLAIDAAIRGTKISCEQLGGSTQRGIVLTPRQQQIRSLLRQGMSNKMIAHTLGIAEGTVKNHITDILRAVNATNRTQAAQFDSWTE